MALDPGLAVTIRKKRCQTRQLCVDQLENVGHQSASLGRLNHAKEPRSMGTDLRVRFDDLAASLGFPSQNDFRSDRLDRADVWKNL
jgi:hypothetical protein